MSTILFDIIQNLYLIKDKLISTVNSLLDDRIKLYSTITQTFYEVCPECKIYTNAIIQKGIEINSEYNIISNFWWFLTNDIIIKMYSRFTLMETMLLLDGLINSMCFIRDYLVLAVSIKKLTKKVSIKCSDEIVDNYNSIYILSSIDRYIFYLIIYIGYNSINYFVNKNQYSYLLILFIVFPYVQNKLVSIRFLPIKKSIDFYIENKYIFIKYSISKLAVQFIENLHPQIEKIQNYHIFIIYRTISINFIFNIIKNIMLIFLLHTLRSIKSTYYYYKGIKLAYYQNTGYLYNVLNLENALFITNKVIKEKRWKQFDNIEIINSLFVLITHRYDLFNQVSISFNTSLQLALFKLFSLWSLVSLLKMIHYMDLISDIWICIFLTITCVYLTKINTKNIITSLIVYFLILFNINDLIITLVIIINKIVYYWIAEVCFFTYNINNIRKVIDSYEQTIKKDILTNMNKDYEII